MKFASTFDWLTQTPGTRSEPERRRARLLAWILLFILLLIFAALVLVLIVNPPGSVRRTIYVELITGLIALILLAYGLLRTGHYFGASGILIASAVLGPWGSLILDPTILRGDFVPLTYIAITVLLSSILAPTVVTIILAVVQWTGLLFVLLSSPAMVSFNLPSFLGFVFCSSVLSILANTLSQRDMEQIEQQAHQLAESQAQLREQSIRDHLTGLFNRRYLEETLEREIQRAARKQMPLGIIMLDADHLKDLNDTLGHAAGDVLLKELGALLAAQVRYADIACRYGGDEFVLILPESPLKPTRERAEAILTQLKQLAIEYKNKPLGTLTISVGVAIFPHHGATGEAVLKSADAALYRAKMQGRGCVIVADAPENPASVFE